MIDLLDKVRIKENNLIGYVDEITPICYVIRVDRVRYIIYKESDVEIIEKCTDKEAQEKHQHYLDEYKEYMEYNEA